MRIIGVPKSKDGLCRAVGEAHRRYTRRINFRENWRGHLWQERFASFPMDEQYLLETARYIEMNPVAAKMVQRPEDYPWSSAKAHLKGEDDHLVKVRPLLQIVPDWSDFLQLSSDEEIALIQRHDRTGRPLGNNTFVDNLEKVLGRRLKPQKPGPKKQDDN